MSLGLHSFYGYSVADTHRITNKQDYFIGCLTGDHFADEHFELLLKKVLQRLTNSLGNRYTYHWTPLIVKPYRARTADQKMATAIKKTTNKHLKKVRQIKDTGYLFEEAFIQEEEAKLFDRKQALTMRYALSVEPGYCITK